MAQKSGPQREWIEALLKQTRRARELVESVEEILRHEALATVVTHEVQRAGATRQAAELIDAANALDAIVFGTALSSVGGADALRKLADLRSARVEAPPPPAARRRR